ncbi:hypothetical protein CAPTEDRAFT_191829 [Capitella teleta]|uniref:Transmembrane protein 199 n=1 Tax=Capitella teleta TaxID=283909 RepID=R7U514_CAPTE|nr:hypothetical protein CAPTEDRAFT_191829 [Capitella teleta]|eukprot:ELT98781.1 hypothetical protein CAPTEDRAFT_191829 [Capitella teleta]
MAEVPKSHVLLTEKIKRWIRTILLTANLPHDVREELVKYTSGRRSTDDRKRRSIPFDLVKTVHKHLSEEQQDLYLHELLEGSEVYLHETESRTRDPELEARVQKLKDELAQREYEQMTKNVGFQQKRNPEESIGKQVRSLNKQLIHIFNFLLTVVGSFMFAYKATEYSLEKPNIAVQICSGMVVGTAVFFADLYFLVKHTA